MLAGGVEGGLWGLALLDVGDGLGPGEGGVFALGVGVRGVPVSELGDAGFGLVMLAEFMSMEADAVLAAVEEGGAEADEFEEDGVEAGGGVEVVLDGAHGGDAGGGEVGVAEALGGRFHVVYGLILTLRRRSACYESAARVLLRKRCTGYLQLGEERYEMRVYRYQCGELAQNSTLGELRTSSWLRVSMGV